MRNRWWYNDIPIPVRCSDRVRDLIELGDRVVTAIAIEHFNARIALAIREGETE